MKGDSVPIQQGVFCQESKKNISIVLTEPDGDRLPDERLINAI